METLPFEIYHHVARFLDAPSLLTATLLSKTFFHAVDDNKLWQRAAFSYFPDAEEADVKPYLHDWRALVCDGNRKTKKTVLDTYLFIKDEDIGRIYTRWMPLVGHHPETRISLIVEPQGFAPESFISVYLETDTKEDITLSFRITLLCDKEKGNSRMRECLEHFSTGVSSRGSYSLIRRCEITPTSGFLDEDGILHVKTQVQVFCMKLRVVETSTLQNHRGLGLMNMDSKGHLFEVMAKSTWKTMRQRHFPLQPNLRFWICHFREEEGIIPVKRLTREDEQNTFYLSLQRVNTCGELLVWADRFEESESLYFIKRNHMFCGRTPHPDKKYRWEKNMQLWSPGEETVNNTETAVLLEERSDNDDIERFYQQYREASFAETVRQQQDFMCHARWIPVRDLLCTGSGGYTDWCIFELFQRNSSRKLFFQHVINIEWGISLSLGKLEYDIE